jgi:hypothetical protein
MERGSAMASLVTVAFASNDECGNDKGRAEAVNFVSEEHGNVDLCCQMPRGQVVRREPEMEHGLRVGRRQFRSQGWREGYGNMAWNATAMALPEAERLLRYLLACGYTVEGYDCDTSFATIIEEHDRASRREGR